LARVEGGVSFLSVYGSALLMYTVAGCRDAVDVVGIAG